MIRPDRSGHPKWFHDTPHDFGGDVVGIDTSKFQGIVPWKQVADLGYGFSFLKATDGKSATDPLFVTNLTELLSEKRISFFGTYHWIQTLQSDGKQQGQRNLATYATLPRVADVEQNDGLKGAALADWLKDFCLANEEMSGMVTMIYVGRYFWDEKIGKLDSAREEFFSMRPLWLPAYTGGTTPELPGPWHDVGWSFWQFDGDGGMRLPNGVDVDVSLFAGDLDTLKSFSKQARDYVSMGAIGT